MNKNEVFLKVVHDYKKNLLKMFERQELRFNKAVINRGARHLSFGVRLSDPMMLPQALAIAENIALASGAPNVVAFRLDGLVIYQFQLAETFWQTYTRSMVSGLGIGLGEQRKQVDIDFDDEPQVSVVGGPGCGKTEAIRSAIVALATTYTPDECQFLMLDHHNMLSDFRNLAHLAAPIAVQDREDIDSVLLYAHTENARRMRESLFDAPKLVVVFDEAVDTTSNDERALDIVSRLTNGRKYGVHVILGTQKPTAKKFPDILHNIGNRFIGRINGGARESANITGQPGLFAHRLTKKGDFLHVVGANHFRFQVALATKHDIQRLPRRDVAMPDMTEYPTVTNLPKLPPVERATGGRPTNSLEVPLLADYIYVCTDPDSGPEAISIAGAKEMFGISRGMHDLHKSSALELIDELEKRGLYFCREDGVK